MSPELSLGLFVEENSKDAELIGHVIATRVPSDRVTDAAMEMPESWDGSNDVVNVDGEVIGNDKNGLGIGVHGLVIVPKYQGKGLGRHLMQHYIQYAPTLDQPAGKIVIIAHDHLLKFYESFGFKNLGPSACNIGGGGWYDMVCNPPDAFANTYAYHDYRHWIYE